MNTAGYEMNTEGYVIAAMLPVQAGKGKIEKGKDNTEEVIKDPGTRKIEEGFLEIKAFVDTPEHLAEKARVKAEMSARKGNKSKDNIRQ